MKPRFAIRDLLWLTALAALLTWGALRIANEAVQTPNSARFLYEDNKLVESDD